MKTSKEYKVHFKAANTDYGILTIPKGTLLTHQTANGPDENYHFVDDFSLFHNLKCTKVIYINSLLI